MTLDLNKFTGKTAMAGLAYGLSFANFGMVLKKYFDSEDVIPNGLAGLTLLGIGVLNTVEAKVLYRSLKNDLERIEKAEQEILKVYPR